MKTIQITIDDDLLEEVDTAIKTLNTTRSAFISAALRARLKKIKIEEMDRQHREGYEKYPVQPSEFDGWETEQVWGNE